MNIGLKLRNLRKIKQLTQEELAERTDLSKGYISQIESGQSSPSMETFLQLLEVLGTSPETFFKEKEAEKVLYPKDEQTVYDEYDEGYILTWPIARSNEFEMEPLFIQLHLHTAYKSFKPSDSDTFIYCLEGELTLTLGEHVYHAKAGDALYFKAHDKHQLSNQTDTETKAMMVVTASYL
ncbi:helix-turn-helix domain-containing protein [Staphylococcus simulans]|uniref:helix-turn-helix domain-containing protein n=1 Tax=Staphylococcus simulans TaxID=1286 RepID=UPI000D0283C9|nr:XRE family transcriptional regulator [Staphylococcus simulans]